MQPLEPLIVQHIKSGCTMHMNKTTVKVLEYEGDVETADGKPRSKSYMWLASGGPKGKPAVVFRYNKSRSGTNASEFINGFSGYCFMYTLIENAKLSGLVPYDYLRCLFEQAADLDENSDWSKLLPWNIKITPWKDLGQW